MARSIRKSIVLVSAAFALYVLSVFLMPDVVMNLAALACDVIAASLIFQAVFTSDNREFRPHYILLGAGVVSWALADLFWLICDQVLHIDPDSVGYITVLYFGTNAFLAAATVLYVVFRMRKWDRVQLTLDAVTFSAVILWLAWVLMLNRRPENLELYLGDTVIGSATIVLDVFLIIIIGVWYLSIRKGRIPLHQRILSGSIFCFSFIDLTYYYIYAQGLYDPGSLIDVLYTLSLFGIAVSIKLYYLRYPTAYNSQNIHTNIGHGQKGLMIVLCPIIIMLFTRINLTDMIVYGGLLLFHEASSSYIQKALRDKALLDQEMIMNRKLEQLVSEKVRDLESANAELRRRNEDLRYVALHDSLTGLYNRTYFMERLDEFINTVSSDDKVMLMMWNVDNLKGINDTYGHYTGDQLLIWHAENVRKLFDEQDVLARLGGDEFALLHRSDQPQTNPLSIAAQVVASCREPFRIGEYTIQVSVSVGICQYPTCSSDKYSLLNHADTAMHNAKETQPDNHISMYSEIDKAMQRKYRIGNYLKAADYDRDLQLHFQPQFRTADRKLIGMEALLRWNCPGIGPVSPAEFIPIAEEANLIIPIGNWVIENAVRQIAVWNHAYQANLRMGINISPMQFDQPGTYTVLDAAIQRNQAAEEWIDIEITEGLALGNEERPGNIMEQFQNKGISISIDDFGTGYSSLGYLSILAFDRLKIAKPLIDHITTDESSQKIVASIILLAKSLDLLTISEGVETREQFDLLHKLGCDQIQGYYLGKPVPAGEFEDAFLKAAATG